MARKTQQTDIKGFFGDFYQKPDVLPQGEYDEAVTRLVVKTVGNIVVGDQALQSLLTHYVMSNAASTDELKNMAAAVAGIKQMAVDFVARKFPNADLDTLVSSARDAGYDVQVLGRI